MNKYKLAIIILNFNTRKLLDDCLDSIYSNKLPRDCCICVVDNNSSDGSSEMIKSKYKQVELIESPENGGFSKGNNIGLKKIEADWYLLLNSDTLVVGSAVGQINNYLDSTKFDIFTCKVLNPDKTIQPNTGDLPFGISLISWLSGARGLAKGKSFHHDVSFYSGEKEVGWVSGTAMIIKDSVLKKIGGLDENIFMYGEDVEFCIRARKAGFNVGWADVASIVHLGGGSSADPKLRQWLGEFKGVLYIYKKYTNNLATIVVKLLIYLFVFLRAIVFLLLGKRSVSRTYFRILGEL